MPRNPDGDASHGDVPELRTDIGDLMKKTPDRESGVHEIVPKKRKAALSPEEVQARQAALDAELEAASEKAKADREERQRKDAAALLKARRDVQAVGTKTSRPSSEVRKNLGEIMNMGDDTETEVTDDMIEQVVPLSSVETMEGIAEMERLEDERAQAEARGDWKPAEVPEEITDDMIVQERRVGTPPAVPEGAAERSEAALAARIDAANEQLAETERRVVEITEAIDRLKDEPAFQETHRMLAEELNAAMAEEAAQRNRIAGMEGRSATAEAATYALEIRSKADWFKGLADAEIDSAIDAAFAEQPMLQMAAEKGPIGRVAAPEARPIAIPEKKAAAPAVTRADALRARLTKKVETLRSGTGGMETLKTVLRKDFDYDMDDNRTKGFLGKLKNGIRGVFDARFRNVRKSYDILSKAHDRYASDIAWLDAKEGKKSAS